MRCFECKHMFTFQTAGDIQNTIAPSMLLASTPLLNAGKEYVSAPHLLKLAHSAYAANEMV